MTTNNAIISSNNYLSHAALSSNCCEYLMLQKSRKMKLLMDFNSTHADWLRRKTTPCSFLQLRRSHRTSNIFERRSSNEKSHCLCAFSTPGASECIVPRDGFETTSLHPPARRPTISPTDLFPAMSNIHNRFTAYE